MRVPVGKEGGGTRAAIDLLVAISAHRVLAASEQARRSKQSSTRGVDAGPTVPMNGTDRRIARCSYRPAGGARHAVGGRSLRDERDHRAADRGAIAIDGEHSCAVAGRGDSFATNAIARTALLRTMPMATKRSSQRPELVAAACTRERKGAGRSDPGKSRSRRQTPDPRQAGPVESPTRCPYDNEGRSVSAVASRPERGSSTPIGAAQRRRPAWPLQRQRRSPKRAGGGADETVEMHQERQSGRRS